jgi:Putative adhesin
MMPEDGGNMMRRQRNVIVGIAIAAFAIVASGCAMGPAVTGAFDRSFTVTAPIRLELSNASGDVTIKGSSDNKVHIHGDVHSSGVGFDSPQKRLDAIVGNPPVEQKGDTIRVGKDLSRIHNVSIAYTIEIPHDSEISTQVVSGSQSITNVRGPVKVDSASGSIKVSDIDRQTTLNTLSGSIDAQNIGDDLRASSASGSVTASKIKGDVRISALSGGTQIIGPGGRVDADTATGTVEVQGATRDVKAHAVSGTVNVQGNPGDTSYWDLKTTSGVVHLGVPSNANFRLSAEAVSGQIKTEVPIVIEEQGKHSLRARMGNGGGRVEVHTISGEIRVSAS